MRTVKSIITKCLQSGQSVDQALLNLRATPIDFQLPSPAEILFGRPICTTLPSNHPFGATQKQQVISDRLEDRRSKMKTDHDAHAGPELQPLFVGQPLRILDTATSSWTPVTSKESVRSLGRTRLQPQTETL